MHFEKPGQIILTKESVLYKVNINDEQLSHFFMKLVERLVEATKAYFDFFVPLGSSGENQFNLLNFKKFNLN